MSARIPLKYSLLMLLGGLICATGIVFLVSFLLDGPKLGAHYDFLLSQKKSPVTSHEILIIETDEFVEGNDLFTVFLALIEMDAANLVMTGKLSPSTSPIMLTETEIRRRFMDEYSIVGSNIRNLFEGIRMGTVTPLQAPFFVERVVELTELGRDRLVSALVDRDEDLFRAAAVFGNYLEADKEPLFDWDGGIRRVRPLGNDYEEAHPVYLNLRNRYIASHIEETLRGQVLWMRRSDGQEFDIPLDRNGNIITAWNCEFRRIDISLFREYEEAENTMRDVLAAADELGIFSLLMEQTMFEQTGFEISPFILCDYALTLREELLKTVGPSVEQTIMTESSSVVIDYREAWKTARTDYFKSLNDFLDSSAEMYLVNRYEKKIGDTDPSDTEEIISLINMRDDIIDVFTLTRDTHKTLSSIRSKLDNELKFSYCIMGPHENTLYSALIANVLITGSHINPAYNREILIFSVTASTIVLLIIFLTRPALLLITGLLLSFLSSFAFAFVFIFYSYWIDPIIVLCSSLTGTLVIFYCKCTYLKHRVKSFKAAYGAIVPKNFLQSLIFYGRPKLSEINRTFAVIVAVKNVKLLRMENIETVQDAGTVRKEFLSSVKEAIFNAGAVIVGFEGDTILACFGSPLELQPGSSAYKWSNTAKSYSPVDKACAFVREIMADEENPWCFGIDAGDCTFYWSRETGYSVNGRPPVRARLLVSKTSRLKVKALITDVIRKKTDMHIDMYGEKLGTLYDRNDPFFEFPPKH